MYSATPDQLYRRRHRDLSSHSHDPTAETSSIATIHPSSRHDYVQIRPLSPGSNNTGPRKPLVAVAGLSSCQEPRGHNKAPGNYRAAIRQCTCRHLIVFVGVFAAGCLAALYATFLLTLPSDAISRLRPENISIRAKPFPLADLVLVSELYANASDAINIPHRDLNVTPALDAPGLVRINVASWLSQTTIYPHGGENGKRLPVESAPYMIDSLNVTITLQMLDSLWPVLLHAATDLLAVGLGRGHPEYPSLRAPLFALRHWNGRKFLVIAGRKWGSVRSQSTCWPLEARHSRMMAWLEGAAKAMAARAAAQNESSGSSSRLTIGSRVPSFQELLDYDGGWQQALPKLLSSLPLSPDALSQLRPIHGTLLEYRVALGMEGGGWGRDSHGLCRHDDADDLLRAIVEGRCSGNHTTKMRHYMTGNEDATDYSSVAGIWDAVCDVESFLSYVQALAEGVRDRVEAAVAERGGMSLRERIASYFSKDGIERRMETFDHALHVFRSLRLGLRPQFWMLANMASKMLRACALQEELRQHVRALDEAQSAWWHLEWDDVRETANLTFVTFPPVQDTVRELRVAMQRIEAWAKPNAGTWYMGKAIAALESVVLPGWIDRVGLGGLPLEPWEADAEFDYPFPPNSRMANLSRTRKARQKTV